MSGTQTVRDGTRGSQVVQKERIFNQRKRRVFRKRISNGEVVFGVFFLGFIVVMGLWFAWKKNDYDPRERDISMKTLVQDEVKDTLYRTPFKRWEDPAKAGEGGGAAAVDLGPMPPAILDEGWQPSSRLQQFDKSNLYEKIDGAAPQYFQYGFKGLSFVSIKKPNSDDEISVEFYDMDNFPNALGIFAAQRNEDKVIDHSEEAYYYPTEAGAIGIVDKYYFKITGTSSDKTIQEKAMQIVRAFGEIKGAGAEDSKTFKVFSTTLGVPFAGITFEKSDVFQYDFAKDFWFGKPKGDSKLRYYVHFAKSEDDAKDLYNQMKDNLLYDYTMVTEKDDEVVLKHNFLKTFFTMKRQGKMVLGVDGAPKQEDADASLSKLLGAFTNEKTEANPTS